MTVLIAPDKFKGSLTAREACDAIHDALITLDPSLDLIDMPLADGGEGTCELLTAFSHGTLINVAARDPLFRKIDCTYGISRDSKIAFLEMATASGLQLLKDHERNPLITSTVGTGDMIRHALDKGVEKILIGIGGSATTDCGMGMAEALGIFFFDSNGQRLKGIGASMQDVRTIDTSGAHPRLRNVQFTVFCDVDNTLHGRDGAAYVFSPQKGANPSDVVRLDEGLQKFEQTLKAHVHFEVDFPGAGAGGGLPAALKAFASVEIQPGMDFITRFIGLEDYVKRADVVITGEGKIDAQTMAGKVVKGVADIAIKYRKALMVVTGKSELPEESIRALSIKKMVTLVDNDTSEAMAIVDAYRLVGERVREAWPALK